MPKSNANPKMKVRAVRRRRYRPGGIDSYMFSGRLEPLYAGCRTVEELRERFRKFAADDALWKIFKELQQENLKSQKALDAIEKRCRQIGGR